MSSPARDARIVACPAPTMVTVLPFTVATAGVRLTKVTPSPDVAVADTANDAAPYVLAGIAVKSIDWSDLPTDKVPSVRVRA